MKKLQLLLVLLVVMVLLALSDYVVTQPNFNLPSQTPAVTDSSPITSKTQTKEIIEKHPELSDYHLEKTVRSTNLFEHFNISGLNLESYKNTLTNNSLPPIIVYEIKAPRNQGKFTFLSLKLELSKQISPGADLNVTNQFGQSSLFYNDQNTPSTGFLLVQLRDTIVGFQYAKASPESFDYIKTFVQVLNTIS